MQLSIGRVLGETWILGHGADVAPWEGVISVVSEVLCRPGFVSGPAEATRLARNVRTGRVDVQTMPRLLRWLRGERAEQELRERGLAFVGPGAHGTCSRAYTTGLGVTHLLEKVAADKHPVGTHFVYSFASAFDACAGVVSGVMAEDPDSTKTAECRGSGDSRTSGTCPVSDQQKNDLSKPSSPLVAKHAVQPPSAANCTSTSTSGSSKASSKVSRKASNSKSSSKSSRKSGVSTRSGSASSRRGVRVSAPPPKSADPPVVTVPTLFDEKPKHRFGCNEVNVASDGVGTSTTDGLVSAFGGVAGMSVKEWVEAYGECDGPMLMAWAFRVT